jgi:hypothetical protein
MDASALASAESWLSVIGTAKLIAAFLVAIGVAIEFGGDWVAKPFEKIIEDARRLEFAELHKQSDDAKLETARLSKEADTARASIAAANARAAEAQLALEKLKTPRSLTPDQQSRIVSKIRKFAPQEYALAVGPGSEPSAFLAALDKVLSNANWVKVPPFGMITVQTAVGPAASNSLSGVRIQVASSKEPELREAVVALLAALASENIEADAAQSPTEMTSRPTAIQIVVGIKPLQ